MASSISISGSNYFLKHVLADKTAHTSILKLLHAQTESILLVYDSSGKIYSLISDASLLKEELCVTLVKKLKCQRAEVEEYLSSMLDGVLYQTPPISIAPSTTHPQLLPRRRI